MNKTIIMLRTTSLLDAFGLAVSEKTFDVRLVVKDDYCTVQTYTNRDVLVGESNKIELLGCSCDAEGVYRYPLGVFARLLGVITKDLEEYNSDITALVFDEESSSTTVITSEGKFKINYYHKVR